MIDHAHVGAGTLTPGRAKLDSFAGTREAAQ